ncbi:MAG: hypothetical protein ACKOEM_19595 [Planctomycetia bacterium]
MRRLILLATIDARRPAAWLALVVAVVGAALLSAAPLDGCPTPSVIAAVVGAGLAVAAIGDATPRANAADLDVARVAERAAWPLVGWLVAAGGLGDALLAATGALGILAGGGLFALLSRRGMLAADAASATLVVTAGAGALGWWAGGAWPGRMPGGAGAGGVLAGVTIGAWAMLGRWPSSAAMPARSTARHLLTAAAMMGAMAGMVGWLFLAADLARLDLVASLAWFVALAVPAATLGDGVSHAVVWQRLAGAAPRGGGWRPAPGRVRDSLQATLTTAALLGWPPLVVAALAGSDAARLGAALSVVAALAVAAAVLLAIVGLGGVARATPDTQLAVAITGTCLCMAAVPVIGAWLPPDLLARPFVGW